MLKTFSGRRASQHPEEIFPLISLFREREIRTYLEIGARHGDTFHLILSKVPTIEVAVAVDLPGGPWGTEGTERDLEAAVLNAQTMGAPRYVRTVLGDSQTDETLAHVLSHLLSDENGLFDAVFIDGDHRYDGVKRDFELYGSRARKLVVFHDIAGRGVVQRTQGHVVEVPRFWEETKQRFPHFEFVKPDDKRPMGIGVLDMEAPRHAF